MIEYDNQVVLINTYSYQYLYFIIYIDHEAILIITVINPINVNSNTMSKQHLLGALYLAISPLSFLF